MLLRCVSVLTGWTPGTVFRLACHVPCLGAQTDPDLLLLPSQHRTLGAGLQDLQHLAQLLHRQKQNITQAALQKEKVFSSAYSEMKRSSEKY